jgi:methionine-rich copper-binding protein CopC
VTVSLALLAGAPGAHSLLLASSPAAGSVVSAPPGQITLGFNNRIEKRLSRIRLVGGGETRDLSVSADGRADSLTATVPPLAPGTYRVEWQVLSADGHVVSGVFSFRLER